MIILLKCYGLDMGIGHGIDNMAILYLSKNLGYN